MFRWDSVGEGLSIGSAGTGPSTIIYYLKIRHARGKFSGGVEVVKGKNVRCRAGQDGVKQNRNGNFVRLKITQFCFGNCVPDYENKPNTRLFFLLL